VAELESAAVDRRGRVGQSATLGSYVEYRERLAVALWPLLPCLLAATYWAYMASSADAAQNCWWSRGYEVCQSLTAADNRAGAAVMALILLIVGVLYLARKVLHRPWVRVGELGIEDRTQLFGIVRVGWEDVLLIPASSSRPLTASVDVRVRAKSALAGTRGWVRIRTGGLSRAPVEIEAQMDTEYRAFHKLSPRAYQPRSVSGKKVIEGIEVQTAKETWSDVTRADIHHLIERNGLGDYLVIVSKARGQERFIQARHTDRDIWDVEYRDGSPERQFAASCMTNTEVFDAFMAWIRRDSNLLHLLDWRRLEDQTWDAVAAHQEPTDH
jgi:hypothetical protein